MKSLGRALAGIQGLFRPDWTSPTGLVRWDLAFDDIAYEGNIAVLSIQQISFRAVSRNVEILPGWHEQPDSLILRGRVVDHVVTFSPLFT